MEDPTFWSHEHLHTIELLDRYKTQAERAFRRALVNVQAIRKDASAQERWRDQLAFKREQLEFQRQKFEYTQARHAKHTPAQEAAAAAAAASEARKREVEEIIADVHASNAPIQTREDFGGCVIYQRTFIAIQNGRTFINEVIPSHEKVRQIIAHRESYKEVPQAVVRRFEFCDGIPAEYEWIIDGGCRRPIDDTCSIHCHLTFDEWHALADTEDQMVAIQPEFDWGEDDDESEEDETDDDS